MQEVLLAFFFIRFIDDDVQFRAGGRRLVQNNGLCTDGTKGTPQQWPTQHFGLQLRQRMLLSRSPWMTGFAGIEWRVGLAKYEEKQRVKRIRGERNAFKWALKPSRSKTF